MKEQEPDTENVVYMDEYPELRKRVWLRRLNAARQATVIALPRVIQFPQIEQPDEPA